MILRVSDNDIVDTSKVGYITIDGQKIIFGDLTWSIYNNEMEAQCVFNNIVNHMKFSDMRFSSDKLSSSSDRKEKAFEMFWNLYDKKVSITKAKTSFMQLTLEEMGKAIKSIKAYVESTPNKEYRKHPTTWINQRCWEDEIISKLEGDKKTVNRYVKPNYITDER